MPVEKCNSFFRKNILRKRIDKNEERGGGIASNCELV